MESEENEQTLDGLRECMRQWREIGKIPVEFQDEIDKSYKFHVEKYYNQLSIFYELKKLDKDKNLEVKIDLIKRAEQLSAEPNIRKALLQLNKYHEDWKNTGPVRAEISDEIWMRFKQASDIVVEAKKFQQSNIDIEKQNRAQKIKTEFKVISSPKILGKIDLKSESRETKNFTDNFNLELVGKPGIKEFASVNSGSLSKIGNVLQHNKLGRVKFFDPNKGFGYVYSYKDEKDCFVHISKLIVDEIYEDEVVVFKTVDSRKLSLEN